MRTLPPRPSCDAVSDTAAGLAQADLLQKQQLFRALHGANPSVRRALVLVANGRSIEEAARSVGCHPAFLRRRFEALARPVA